MKHLDAVAGEFESVERLGVACLHCGVDFAATDAHVLRIEVKAVELARRLEQRDVAARGDIVDNGASISADTSRLAPRKPANRSAKSALLLSRRTGILIEDFVIRLHPIPGVLYKRYRSSPSGSTA
jgi:hypothetical protein